MVALSFRWKILLATAVPVVAVAGGVLLALRRTYEPAVAAEIQKSLAVAVEQAGRLVERRVQELSGEAEGIARDVRIREALAEGNVRELEIAVSDQHRIHRISADALAFFDGEARFLFRLRLGRATQADGSEAEVFRREETEGGPVPEEAYLRLFSEGAGPDRTPLLLLGEAAYTPAHLPVGEDEGFVLLARRLRDSDAADLGSLVGEPVLVLLAGRAIGTSLSRDETTAVEATLGTPGAPDPLDATVGGTLRRVLSATLPSAGDGRALAAVVAADLGRRLGPLREAERTTTLVAAAALLTAVLLSLRVSGLLARPVRQLADATERVARGDFSVRVPVRSRDEIGTLANRFNQMTEGLAEKERVRGLLDKVVSTEIAGELVRLEKEGRLALGGETREVSVLFCDLRGFTATTEHMKPEAVIAMMNEYFTRITVPIERERGVIDKFVGDQVMALFGAPLPVADHAARAVAAARGMLEALAGLNREREARGEKPLACGIGINSGEAVAGLSGSGGRFSYTVFGATVNLAARLCSAAQRYQILVTAGTRDRAALLDTRALEPIKAKGFSEPVPIFEVPAVGIVPLEAGAETRYLRKEGV
ncbi:MAG: adenylate/guanylate cyclase domain-containing protein [Planctomycetales bacterium]|nr:adenylate/guanylate cyclase domain-containing protein [Planctomycetales bacterium]